MQPAPSRTPDRPRWALAAGLGALALGVLLTPLSARQDDNTQAPQAPRYLPGAGASADSNGRMIAVTGVDLTGSSILYLVDTQREQICVYQGSGGSNSTQGLRFVGARNISLDLRLDGFNDKTTSDGKPLPYKELERKFSAQGIPTEGD